MWQKQPDPNQTQPAHTLTSDFQNCGTRISVTHPLPSLWNFGVATGTNYDTILDDFFFYVSGYCSSVTQLEISLR